MGDGRLNGLPPHVVTAPPAVEDETDIERVRFAAADGGAVAGYYVPASRRSHATALVCHGLAGDPAGFTSLIDRLHRRDIGVLAITLRAHGDSGGQVCTFGITERADVLGAVDWLKTTHARECRRLVGVGASLGAAALLSAATDEPRLDGVVVLSAYSTLPAEVDSVAKRQLVQPLGWLVRAFGLPFASLHAGVDLRQVRPADDIEKLWPRPVLIIHGTGDEIIPFEQGQTLYNAAPIGRQSLWAPGGTHNGILEDETVLRRIILFVQQAGPVPLV